MDPNPLTINEGDKFSTKIRADEGCWVESVYMNGKLVSKTNKKKSYYNVKVYNVDDDVNVSATCTCPPETHEITSSTYGDCEINPRGVVSVNENGSQTYTFYGTSGSTVSSVVVDGVAASGNDNGDGTYSYTFSNVTSDHTIIVGCTCPPPSVPKKKLTVEVYGGCIVTPIEGTHQYA